MAIRDHHQRTIDRFAVDALVQRERAARDGERWEEMAACHHPQSHVEVSWFQGSGAEFVSASRKMTGAVLGIHHMSPSIVTLKGDRAIASTGCCMQGITRMDGAEIMLTSHTRLLWRALRSGENWRIAGLRAYYLFDAIAAVRPDQPISIDEDLYASLRAPYRWIAYSSIRAGRQVPYDLPAIDRPQQIAAMLHAEEAWLAANGSDPGIAPQPTEFAGSSGASK